MTEQEKKHYMLVLKPGVKMMFELAAGGDEVAQGMVNPLSEIFAKHSVTCQEYSSFFRERFDEARGKAEREGWGALKKMALKGFDRFIKMTERLAPPDSHKNILAASVLAQNAEAFESDLRREDVGEILTKAVCLQTKREIC